jgi:hypothetical protein
VVRFTILFSIEIPAPGLFTSLNLFPCMRGNVGVLLPWDKHIHLTGVVNCILQSKFLIVATRDRSERHQNPHEVTCEALNLTELK